MRMLHHGETRGMVQTAMVTEEHCLQSNHIWNTDRGPAAKRANETAALDVNQI